MMLFASPASAVLPDAGGGVPQDPEDGGPEIIRVTDNDMSMDGVTIFRDFPISNGTLSGDGRRLGFSASVGRLVEGDTNRVGDAFVYDRRTDETVRVSVSSSGEQANNYSGTPTISPDGRYAAFWSRATNLVDQPVPPYGQVYLHDLQTRTTTLVSVNSRGEPSDHWVVSGSEVAVSAHGRYVAFTSGGTNLSARMWAGNSGVFVHDTTTGNTSLVSVLDDRSPAGNSNFSPSMSPDGRYVAFAAATYYHPDRRESHIYVRDRQLKKTTLVSLDSNGQPAGGTHSSPSVSADGSRVVFASHSDNVVPADTNRSWDVFVHDLDSKRTQLVSQSSAGAQATRGATQPQISASGRYVTFQSPIHPIDGNDFIQSGVNYVYVRDLETRETMLASRDHEGLAATAMNPSISLNGRFVSFDSSAQLVPGDDDSNRDVYLRDYRNHEQTYPDEEWNHSTYVAMGDSYQSGVGIGTYYPETFSDQNMCKRSPHAYGPRLSESGAITEQLRFVACGGAVVDDLYAAGSQWNEGSQLGHLGAGTGVVTIGIGGNDVGFGPVLQGCIKKHYFLLTSCESEYDGQVTDAILGLVRRDETGLNKFQKLFGDIRFRAPNARVITLGYPKWFAPDGADLTSLRLRGVTLDGRCQGIRISDQVWIDYKISQLNQAIEVSALSMGAEYVDIYEAFGDYKLCNANGYPALLNGIVLDGLRLDDSFHPTENGHAVMFTEILEYLGLNLSTPTYTIYPGDTVTQTYDVDGGPGVTFATEWPGSDVEMTLISPSGRVIDRSTAASDVYHRLSGTQELYVVSDPEPGEWTIELYGLDVAAEGEPTELHVYEQPQPNADPVAEFDLIQEARTIHVDAAASTDSDGRVTRYIWDFGDGTVAEGVTATHTYEVPGLYRVNLIAVDDDGALGFGTADSDVDLVYGFEGFHAPVQNAPAINRAAAGEVVPIRFTLQGEWGPNVLKDGSPMVRGIDCATGDAYETTGATSAGPSGLSYHPQTGAYAFMWKTDAAWKGSCRRLVLEFRDGSTRSAEFSFR